jgi:hypothetical protein
MPDNNHAAAAERRFRQLLADNDLPQPDEVEQRPGELLFLFHATKLAVVVELEDDPVAATAQPPPARSASRRSRSSQKPPTSAIHSIACARGAGVSV